MRLTKKFSISCLSISSMVSMSTVSYAAPVLTLNCFDHTNQKILDLDVYKAGHPMAGLAGYFAVMTNGSNRLSTFMRACVNYQQVSWQGTSSLESIEYKLDFGHWNFDESTESDATLHQGLFTQTAVRCQKVIPQVTE